MELGKTVGILFIFLLVGAFGRPRKSAFPSCQSQVCYSGGKTGYGCHSGVCNYTCSKSQCRGFNNSVFSHKGIEEKWGSGALGKQGCYGGNCGYWSGCKDGKCNGFYDFTQCQGGECMSGAFHGYGCLPGGSCQVICLNDVCHSVDNYGQIYTLPMSKDGVANYANALSGYAYDPAMMYGMPGPDYPVQSLPQPPSALPSVHTMDSEVLKHLLINAPNLQQILLAANPVTLRSAFILVPGLEHFASTMDALSLQAMIAGLPNVKDVVAMMDPVLLHSVISNVPNIDSMLFAGHPYFSKSEAPHTSTTKKAGGQLKTSTPVSSNLTSMPVTTDGTKATQAILSMLPSIPIQYADTLFNADPSFVQYVVENHQNLHGLLASMDAKTLLYVTAHVPNFGAILANTNAHTVELVFNKLPNAAKYLQSVDAKVLHALTAKLPSLAKYAPLLSTKTALPGESPLPPETTTTAVTQATPTTVATEAPAFTEEELEMVRSKIPLIDYPLKLMDWKKLAALQKLAPNLPQLLATLEPPKLKALNSHLTNVSSLLNKVENMLLNIVLAKVKEEGGIFGALVGMLV